MSALFAHLHFLRPQWLWALAALPLLVWWWRVQRRRGSVWRGKVDPHLLPHLLDAGATRQGRGGLALRLLAWTLAVLALAGPSWRQGDAPLQQGGRPLVLALDLSTATLAADLPPSRLLQARAKLGALLRERAGGDVALVAFAEDAHTVAPLTDDGGNVAIFLDALAPDVMPVDGHRPDRAIEAAMELMRGAGYAQGDILLLTDHADAAAIAAATRAAAAGFRVSALGLGSAAGAAYRGGDGSIGRTRLDAGSLRQMAAAGGGRYAAITTDRGDLDALGVLVASGNAEASDLRRGATRVWRDEGYWLLLPLLLLGLFAFRRGAAFAVVAACMLLPLPQAHAADDVQGGLWRRADQAAHARMREGIDAYRSGKFEDADRGWQGLSGADAAYNRGNALAKSGRYEDALKAYDEALRQQPGMEDAIANRAAVESALRRQPPQDGKNKNKQDQRGSERSPGQGQSGGEDAQPPQQGEQGQEQGEGSGQGNEGQPPPRSEADTSRAGQRGQQPPDEPATQPEPSDQAGQREADAAQREQMQRALQESKQDTQDSAGDGEVEEGKPDRAETEAERERRQANDAWLRRVPDDPGGLLRSRFRLEYERRNGLRDSR